MKGGSGGREGGGEEEGRKGREERHMASSRTGEGGLTLLSQMATEFGCQRKRTW